LFISVSGLNAATAENFLPRWRELSLADEFDPRVFMLLSVRVAFLVVGVEFPTWQTVCQFLPHSDDVAP